MKQGESGFTRLGDHWQGRFRAMASPCEVLIDLEDETLARDLFERVQQEAWRIEAKFSRYRDDNIVHQINHADGKTVCVDEETRQLFEYARQCHALSNGKFDITSGVLREVWTFDGGDRLPDAADVEVVRQRVGWDRVDWQPPCLTLKPGMEIDLGGLGKEYAVDRAALLLHDAGCDSALVNFGGDVYVLGPRRDGRGWAIGLEDPHSNQTSLGGLTLSEGGLATSGDSHRYLLHKGVRYSHILDPTTGWPVPDAPRSITVLAPTCLQAGMLATFAMLQGAGAEAFLDDEGVKYWCIR
ncbi:MAG: FAD:protein FMN transferase [Gammaproteobacteria bacterium]|nr:FAD:protein FMN transferase [Gammaproteobacteria bacterium]